MTRNCTGCPSARISQYGSARGSAWASSPWTISRGRRTSTRQAPTTREIIRLRRMDWRVAEAASRRARAACSELPTLPAPIKRPTSAVVPVETAIAAARSSHIQDVQIVTAASASGPSLLTKKRSRKPLKVCTSIMATEGTATKKTPRASGPSRISPCRVSLLTSTVYPE